MQAPLPIDEEDRLKALRRYDVVDTAPEGDFDDITTLASHICETPIALITLLDDKRQWFKSKIGITFEETSREIAFCAHGILEADIFVIHDAQADRRFAANPLVTADPSIRFYAGVPLLTPDDHALGMLCVCDQAPRDLTEGQKSALRALGRQVVAQLEARRRVRELRETVAQLKQAEEELKWKTAFLEAQVYSSVDGILVVDRNGKKILQNQRFADLLKIPKPIAEEHDDERQLQWVTGLMKNPGQFIERVMHLNSHPGEVSCDEIEMKDGTILDRYSSPVLGKDERYYGRTWAFRDITERKRLETRLFQSQKMETVGKLAGGVAHEFNSIMTAIIGQSELLICDLPPGDPLCKSASEIRKAAERAAMLTQQLLAYGRKQILRPEVLNLNSVLAGMKSALRHLIGRGREVSFLPAASLNLVRADAGQIEQVIMNLAMNGAEATPNGGKLLFETGNVTLDQEYAGRFPGLKAGEYVMLAVTDTGAGMSEAVKARVFDPFFSTKAVGQGVGLGLSTCYGILKQSGGHINVYSEPGRGSVFRIYLPRIEQQQEDPAARRPVPSGLPGGTETILMVEDDPALREMAATLLRRLGYTVLTAADGIEALSLKQRGDVGYIDLLFTDVVMPHMSGKELSERIKASFPHTRILFTSAYTENAVVQQGVMEKGVALLQKPFTPSALAHKLRELLDPPGALGPEPASSP